MRDDASDFAYGFPERSDIFGRGDVDGRARVGIVKGAHGGDAEAGFIGYFR